MLARKDAELSRVRRGLGEATPKQTVTVAVGSDSPMGGGEMGSEGELARLAEHMAKQEAGGASLAGRFAKQVSSEAK